MHVQITRFAFFLFWELPEQVPMPEHTRLKARNVVKQFTAVNVRSSQMSVYRIAEASVETALYKAHKRSFRALYANHTNLQ